LTSTPRAFCAATHACTRSANSTLTWASSRTTPEGWLRESQAALETFRSSGPDTEQRPAMLTVSVQEDDIADVRPVFGKEAE